MWYIRKESKNILIMNCYTISGYKIDQRCEVIFFQDDDKNHCIAFATELFFEEILEKKTSRLVYFICANGINY
jgi:hypothetical protein